MLFPKRMPVYHNISELVEDCYTHLKSHEIAGEKWGKPYHYYRPSLTKYSPCQWLWDSGWHMIVWSHRHPENAVAELNTLFQFQQPDGFIPQNIFWETDNRLKIVINFSLMYSHKAYSDLTQMPMLAYSIRAIWNATHDKNWLRQFVPKMIKYMRWWQSRDHDQDGLISIIHPWESGMDASPIYDAAFKLIKPRPWDIYYQFAKLIYIYRRLGWDQKAIIKGDWFNFEDVGVCSVFADGWGILASLAEEFDHELASQCRQQYRYYQEAILDKCWDKKRRQFVSYFHDGDVEKVSDVETIQTLFPLLLDDLPHDIQLQLVDKLKDPEKFGLRYPVPTAARYTSEFNPNGSRLLWRGPMWPSTTWLLMEGLLKHGFEAEADMILERWTELYLHNGIWEYYNPTTGHGLGQRGLGMSTVIVDWLHRMGKI